MVGWLVLFVIMVAAVVAFAAATSTPRNRRTYLNSYGDGGSGAIDSGTNCSSDSGGDCD